MSSFFFDRRRSEHFAELLEEPHRLRRHRRLRPCEAEMDKGVRTLRRISTMPKGGLPTAEYRDGLRAMLIAVLQRESEPLAGTRAGGDEHTADTTVALGALAAATRPLWPAARPDRDPSSGRSPAPGTGRTRAAVLVGVTAGALALSGVSAASTDSLPGDALYQVKRSSERAQLALAASDQSRGQLYLEFAHSRVLEAHQISTGQLADVLADMDVETVSGVSLLATAAVQRGDANILTAITSFVAQQRERLADLHQALTVSGVEPMRRSTLLLDSVEQRAADLAYALLKGCTIATVDALGPRPTDC